ncbi:PAS domain-containing protein [Streptomyces tremellae]
MNSFDWDLRAGRLDLDPAALAVLGLSPDGYDGRATTATGMIPPEEAARLRVRARLVLRQGVDGFGAYYRARGHDGVLRTLHAQAQIRHDSRGRPNRLVGVVREAGSAGSPAGEIPGRSGLVERLSFLMARAVSLDDVTAALNDPEVLGGLGALGMILGVVEGGRMHVPVHPETGVDLPILERSCLDEPLPMARAVTARRPLFVRSPKEYRTGYPTMWPQIEPFPPGAGAYLPLVAEGRFLGVLGSSSPGRASSTRASATCCSPWRAASRRASRAPSCTARSTTSRRTSSERCCRGSSPTCPAPSSRCATAPRGSAGASAATGTT